MQKQEAASNAGELLYSCTYYDLRVLSEGDTCEGCSY